MLHTRATHPEFDDRVYKNTSWAGRLYGLARQRVIKNVSGVPLGLVGRRTTREEELFVNWTRTHDMSMDTALRFRPEGQTVVLYVGNKGCMSNGGNHMFLWGPIGECHRHLHTVWILSFARFAVRGHYGRLIMVGNRRNAKCIAAFNDGRKQGALSAELRPCKRPTGNPWDDGLVWHVRAGELRSALSSPIGPPWGSCLVYEAVEGKPPSFGFVRCSQDAARSDVGWRVENVTSSTYDKLVRRATEHEFPAALRVHPYSTESKP